MFALTDYESVVAIAEEAHFGRAARRMNVSQPALSARLRRVEETLDARLFDRDRGGVRPTPAGERFVEGAERVIAAAFEAAEAVRDARAGRGQTLRIGMTQVAAGQVVVPTLRALRERHPSTRVRLFEGTTASLERQLEGHRLDAAFLHPPLHASGLSERLLTSVDLVRFDAGPDDTAERPLIRFPRAEAPVLMAELGRRSDAIDGRLPEAEVDTMLGAVVLSRAGFGPFVAPESYPDSLPGTGRTADPIPTGLRLATSIAWRSLDRRSLLHQLIDGAVSD